LAAPVVSQRIAGSSIPLDKRKGDPLSKQRGHAQFSFVPRRAVSAACWRWGAASTSVSCSLPGGVRDQGALDETTASLLGNTNLTLAMRQQDSGCTLEWIEKTAG
jgi:hypothetical protein